MEYIKLPDPLSTIYIDKDGTGGEPAERSAYKIGSYGDLTIDNLIIKTKEATSSTPLDTENPFITIDLNTEVINNGDDAADIEDANGETQSLSGLGPVLVLKLREIDYCDAAGNEKKMVILASQSYTDPV